MKLPSLTRTPKHKRFNYQTRFYDEVKDDLQRRYGQKLEGTEQRDFAERLGEAWGGQRRERNVGLRRLAIFLVLAAVVLIIIFS